MAFTILRSSGTDITIGSSIVGTGDNGSTDPNETIGANDKIYGGSGDDTVPRKSHAGIQRGRIILAALVVGAISASSAFAWNGVATWPEDMNKGGTVSVFEEWIGEANRKNQLVVIEGSCWSACALKLSAKNVCVYPNATIHFHGVHYEGSNDVLPEDNEKMTAAFPLKIQEWIRQNNALASVKIHKVMAGRVAITLDIPDCGKINLPPALGRRLPL